MDITRLLWGRQRVEHARAVGRQHRRPEGPVCRDTRLAQLDLGAAIPAVGIHRRHHAGPVSVLDHQHRAIFGCHHFGVEGRFGSGKRRRRSRRQFVMHDRAEVTADVRRRVETRRPSPGRSPTSAASSGCGSGMLASPVRTSISSSRHRVAARRDAGPKPDPHAARSPSPGRGKNHPRTAADARPSADRTTTGRSRLRWPGSTRTPATAHQRTHRRSCAQTADHSSARATDRSQSQSSVAARSRSMTYS